MAELTVRQDELVVTMEPREKRSLTWFGLRKSRSKLLDGLELRVPLAKVTGCVSWIRRTGNCGTRWMYATPWAPGGREEGVISRRKTSAGLAFST